MLRERAPSSCRFEGFGCQHQPGRLPFLVMTDETYTLAFHLPLPLADRMVQQGHYGELSSILGAIPAQQALAAPEGAEAAEEPEEREPVQRLRAAADREAAEEAGEEDGEAEEGEEEEAGESDDGEEEEAAAAEDRAGGSSAAAQPEQQQRGKAPRPHRMQTFVFSATLTLPANLRRRLRKGGGGASGSSDLDALMDKIPFR